MVFIVNWTKMNKDDQRSSGVMDDRGEAGPLNIALIPNLAESDEVGSKLKRIF